MASGLRLTYMSKLDMHSVTLKVRDIQVWQPSMAPALVSLAGKNIPSYNDKQYEIKRVMRLSLYIHIKVR